MPIWTSIERWFQHEEVRLTNAFEMESVTKRDDIYDHQHRNREQGLVGSREVGHAGNTTMVIDRAGDMLKDAP